jgi:hypothetical protein
MWGQALCFTVNVVCECFQLPSGVAASWQTADCAPFFVVVLLGCVMESLHRMRVFWLQAALAEHPDSHFVPLRFSAARPAPFRL